MANVEQNLADEHWFPRSLRIVFHYAGKMDEERVLMCVLSLAFLICVLTIAISNPNELVAIVKESNAIWAAVIGGPAMMFVRRLGDKNSKELIETLKKQLEKAAA